MRSNRPNYASTPAGSAKAFDQKPKPKRSKREINQLMLMLFFIVLPVLGLLAIFFQPIRWVFMLAVVAAVAAMWVIHAFLFPGRMILTAVYGLLTVFTLINALTASRTSSIRPAQTLLVPTPVPAATDVPFASYGTMGTSVPEEYYGGMTAVEFTGKHYDMGNKLKVVEAQVELALQHPEIGEDFRAYLKEFCKTL